MEHISSILGRVIDNLDKKEYKESDFKIGETVTYEGYTCFVRKKLGKKCK
jgi:hypothetical protein